MSSKNSKVCLLIRGNVGTGKTTLAREWILAHDGVAIAADDMPGLYIDGKYQIEKQSESHRWCMAQFLEALKAGVPVAVHNTFILADYMNAYILAAQQYGYTVRIVKAEVVINPDRTIARSVHDVPQSIWERNRDMFEPYFTPVDRGISITQINQELVGISRLPTLVACDMDGTLKHPQSEKKFPESPEDAMLIEPTADFLKKYYDLTGCIPWVVSNQRGIAGGQKDMEFLRQEVLYLRSLLCVPFHFICAPKRNSNEAHVMLADHEFLELRDLDSKADKPNIGMLEYIAKVKNLKNYYDEFWYIGNAHTSEHYEDWQALQAFRESDSLSIYEIRYIPVEMVPIASQLCQL